MFINVFTVEPANQQPLGTTSSSRDEPRPTRVTLALAVTA
jgi:hypothetical protein